MSGDQDATVYAEALIMKVARAFYDDVAICLIDVLLRDKFLRDDDMAKRLSLSAKQLRATLTFLKSEHLVKSEMVDDLDEGGSQNTIFWYIDYNMAVHTIRLRMYLLQKSLEDAEKRARSCSMYLCPGYSKGLCDGRYTEAEALRVTDVETGLFLCRECTRVHENNPDPPPKEEYTLQLLDNTEDLRVALEMTRRVKVQMSVKMMGNQQLRPGIYDLMQKVRKVAAGVPLTSNLPSENRVMEIGTKRLEGTGRTHAVKKKKSIQQQANGSAFGAGGMGIVHLNKVGSDELTFLKNAMGQQLTFKLEKGGGARANLLATRGQRGRELLHAAAIRIGVDLDLVSLLAKRKREEEQKKEEENKNNKIKKKNVGKELTFLKDNIGREDFVDQDKLIKDEAETSDSEEDEIAAIPVDSDDEFADMTDDVRRVRFSAYYKKEMARQKALMEREMTPGGNKSLRLTQPQVVSDNDIEASDLIAWDDG